MHTIEVVGIGSTLKRLCVKVEKNTSEFILVTNHKQKGFIIMKTETELTLQEILELLRKEIDIYNATNWRSKVASIKNDEHSWYVSDNVKPEDTSIS